MVSNQFNFGDGCLFGECAQLVDLMGQMTHLAQRGRNIVR